MLDQSLYWIRARRKFGLDFPTNYMRTLTFGTAYAGAMGKSMGATAASAKAVSINQNKNTALVLQFNKKYYSCDKFTLKRNIFLFIYIFNGKIYFHILKKYP